MKRTALTLLALSALGLAACEEGASRRNRTADGGGGICKPFGAARDAGPAMGAMADGSTAVDDCLHRWGYTLAKAEDDAESVASAVVAACTAPLARWNQQSLGMAAGPRGGLQEAPSLLTGETTNPILEHNNFAEGRALFYVVQARAGDCEPPRDDGRAANAQPARDTGLSGSPDR